MAAAIADVAGRDNVPRLSHGSLTRAQDLHASAKRDLERGGSFQAEHATGARWLKVKPQPMRENRLV